MTNNSITLRQSRDETGSRYLGATLADDGILTINGQDLGDGVEQWYGPGIREYEWAWQIQPAEVVRLLAALESNDDILTALTARFSGDAAANLHTFLGEHDIQYEPWFRLGD